jgi:osmotically-inducible protein OsmY
MSVKDSNWPLLFLAGVGVGAAMMYLLDPDRGTRRRHMLADQSMRIARDTGRDVYDAAQAAKNHGIGAVAEVRGRLREETVEDEQLVARVRAELGHHVRHARAIEVLARDGCVTLRGPVLADEAEDAIVGVVGVRGVRSVDNQLEVQPAVGSTPPLQG